MLPRKPIFLRFVCLHTSALVCLYRGTLQQKAEFLCASLEAHRCVLYLGTPANICVDLKSVKVLRFRSLAETWFLVLKKGAKKADGDPLSLLEVLVSLFGGRKGKKLSRLDSPESNFPPQLRQSKKRSKSEGDRCIHFWGTFRLSS